ncbi:hypothetical protein N9018_04155 [Rhodopirellula sp.]|nr:hypothetical protein [Rhodopirellula sp.]
MFARSHYLIACLLLSVGCNTERSDVPLTVNPQTPAVGGTSTVVKIPGDPEEAVLAIEAVADKVRRDSTGAIIDVDFRGKDIVDHDLLPLIEFQHLRAVRLGGTAVTDEGLMTVGQIASLEDLDLRDCAVSDDGLAHLINLNKLKASLQNH